MILALQPLADAPGVTLVMFLTPDGVPICVPGRAADAFDQNGAPQDSVQREDALAAIAANWHSEVAQAVGPLSWSSPVRGVLTASRGTLVLRCTRNAILLVLLARGQEPEDMRLPMDGTIARIERYLKKSGQGASGDAEQPRTGRLEEPPAPFSSARTTRSSELEDKRAPSGN